MSLLTGLKTYNKKVYILSEYLTFKIFIHQSQKNVLAFAQRYVEIKQDELDLIFHARKLLLYCKNIPWIKEEETREFDVTIRSNDGTERCELVGLFLLHNIGEKLNKDNVGLCRYDGLDFSKINNDHQNDKNRKELIKVFQVHGLKL